MSYLVLARKWRPQRFADLTGQDVIVRTLKNALTSNHLAHAYLMTGIRGVGKTTISRLMAMAVNCTQVQDGEPCSQCDSCTSIAQGSNLDVQEMDAASHTGVDDIREILDGVRYPPVHLNINVYIIDEAHMLSKSAFNALLKTLEEPPERVLFILATTESDKLPITVRSRCQRFDLRRLNVDEISDCLAYVLKEEGISAQTEALQIIARASDGSVRDALSLTERVLAFSSKDISLDDVEQSLGLIGSEQTQNLADAVLAGNSQQGVSILRQSREVGLSPVHLLKALSERLHEMACCKLDVSLVPQGLSADAQQWLIAQTECWSTQALDIRYQALLHGLRDISLIDEQRGSEMIVIRLCHLYSISPPEKLANLPAPNTEKKTLKNVAPERKPEVAIPERVPAEDSPLEASELDFVHPESVSFPTEHAEADQVIDATYNEAIDEQPVAEITEEELSPPISWEEAMDQYHSIKPGVAAILEHVICERFDSKVRLLLTTHQLEVMDEKERSSFSTWLNRDVDWALKTNESGESLLEQKQREADEYTRKIWQQAEADPNIIALKETLDCRLINVHPPKVHYEESDIIPIEDEQ